MTKAPVVPGGTPHRLQFASYTVSEVKFTINSQIKMGHM